MAKSTPKSVIIPVSQREGFALYLHLRTAQVTSARDQDLHDDLWQAFGLDDIDARCEENAGASFADFNAETLYDVELSREEIAALVMFTTTRPMTGQLARYLMPLRKRWEAARDKEGLKAVPVPGEGA